MRVALATEPMLPEKKSLTFRRIENNEISVWFVVYYIIICLTGIQYLCRVA
jgi:hypothetical protein